MSLNIINQPSGKTHAIRVALKGSLDSETAPQLEAHLDKVLDKHIKALTCDMSGLDFISSAGLRVFVKAQKTLAARGGEVLMAHLQPQIQKVFDIVKALPSMSVFANEQEMDDYLEAMQAKVTRPDE